MTILNRITRHNVDLNTSICDWIADAMCKPAAYLFNSKSVVQIPLDNQNPDKDKFFLIDSDQTRSIRGDTNILALFVAFVGAIVFSIIGVIFKKAVVMSSTTLTKQYQALEDFNRSHIARQAHAFALDRLHGKSLPKEYVQSSPISKPLAGTKEVHGLMQALQGGALPSDLSLLSDDAEAAFDALEIVFKKEQECQPLPPSPKNAKRTLLTSKELALQYLTDRGIDLAQIQPLKKSQGFYAGLTAVSNAWAKACLHTGNKK